MTSFNTTKNLLNDLQNTPLFQEHLKEYLNATASTVCNNLIIKSFAHIKNVLDMYAQIGHENILSVYNLISSLQDFNILECTQWQYCTLSGVVCKKTLLLSADHHVAIPYRSWVYAVWVLTHIGNIEKLRKNNKHGTDNDIATEHMTVYQQCFVLVIQSLVDAFPRILMRADLARDHAFLPQLSTKK